MILIHVLNLAAGIKQHGVFNDTFMPTDIYCLIVILIYMLGRKANVSLQSHGHLKLRSKSNRYCNNNILINFFDTFGISSSNVAHIIYDGNTNIASYIAFKFETDSIDELRIVEIVVTIPRHWLTMIARQN